MIFISFHTTELSLSTKQHGGWIIPPSFYSWKAVFCQPQQSSWHHSGSGSLMATSWSKLICTWTRQTREQEVFHRLLICLPSFANEPYLTPTSLCYLLPLALSSTVSFWSSSTISPLILPSFQFTHPIVVAGCCGNGLSWLFSGEVGG